MTYKEALPIAEKVLTEEELQKWKDNFDEDWAGHKGVFNNPSHVVYNPFSWEESPERHMYWSKINDRVNKEYPTMESLEEKKDKMKPTPTHENYPNHIDENGKPIELSEWEADGNIITVLSTSRGNAFVNHDLTSSCIKINFIYESFTPYTEPKTDFEKAVEQYPEYELLEVSKKNCTWMVGGMRLDCYLSHVDCQGFIYKTGNNELTKNLSICCSKNLTPVAVCMKKEIES